MLARMSLDKIMNEHLDVRGIVRAFLGKDILNWTDIQTRVSESLQIKAIIPADILSELVGHLRIRIIEHNIRMVSYFYEKILIQRLAELLDTSVDVIDILIIGNGIFFVVANCQQDY